MCVCVSGCVCVCLGVCVCQEDPVLTIPTVTGVPINCPLLLPPAVCVCGGVCVCVCVGVCVEVFSVGAAADHSQGFKHGGLQRLLSARR